MVKSLEKISDHTKFAAFATFPVVFNLCSNVQCSASSLGTNVFKSKPIKIRDSTPSKTQVISIDNLIKKLVA